MLPLFFQYFWWINPLISANLQAACVTFIKLLSAQNPDLQGELMDHVKGLIFQPWPPAGKMPAVVQQRPDPWLQGSHCHLPWGPAGHYNATLKVILSVCVDFSEVTGGCQLSFLTFSMEFLWLNPALKQCKFCGWFQIRCGAQTQNPTEWRIPSLTGSSRNSPRILSVICRYADFQHWQKGGTKKEVKGFTGSSRGSLGTYWFWQSWL